MYYKVVSAIDNRLVSAYVYSTIFEQEYKVGEFVFAEDGYPFMVFDDLIRAERFLRGWGDRIYQCEVVNPRKYFDKFCPDIRSWFFQDYPEKKEKEKFFSKLTFDKDVILPGTVFCDGVKLGELIRD